MSQRLVVNDVYWHFLVFQGAFLHKRRRRNTRCALDERGLSEQALFCFPRRARHNRVSSRALSSTTRFHHFPLPLTAKISHVMRGEYGRRVFFLFHRAGTYFIYFFYFTFCCNMVEIKKKLKYENRVTQVFRKPPKGVVLKISKCSKASHQIRFLFEKKKKQKKRSPTPRLSPCCPRRRASTRQPPRQPSPDPERPCQPPPPLASPPQPAWAAHP